VFFCGPANADYFPPALPASNIANQTLVSTALPAPSTTVYVNVTEYDPQQMVKNITVDFREPISYVSLFVDLLKDKPLIVHAPKTAPIIQYFDIRFLTELADKISGVTVVLAVERALLQNMSVQEDSLLLYQYNGIQFSEVCPIENVAENKTYLLFSTEMTAYSLFVITGSTVPSPWWSSVLPIVGVPFLAIVGILVYRRYKQKRPQSRVET
jgi:PGF-pre-PGF domain-containing protein